ncbi:hypothetical protein AH04_6 [Erwinia phage AH04]|uniref:Uncharacterized protein n=1 Tax=Erwinia phage AH04 TaxID=2869569 RepID=A0AAE7X0M1_9CAUD|nr:hypothetical protein PQC02_gp006 [Erwinia phage AH04]QZA70496.1 hypothetical protein AH04_6 [Erwinia phage AH04]
MIVNQSNLSTIAAKFLLELGKSPSGVIPRHINVWPSNNVTATRFINEGEISYVISIDGEDICSIYTPADMDNIRHADIAEAIIDKLNKGAKKYIEWAIEREVGSILDTVRDPRFTTSSLPGGLNAFIQTEKTGQGEIKFIDIYQGSTLVYSSPHATQYDVALATALSKVLVGSYQTTELIIDIP